MTSWWVGKHHSAETKRKISLSNKGRKRDKKTIEKIRMASLGRKHTEGYKEMMRERMLGSKNPSSNPEIRRKGAETWKKKYRAGLILNSMSMLGKKQSEKWKNMRRNLILPVKDTSIEVKIQKFLKDLGITFFTHQYMKEIEHGYQCDILIPIQSRITQKTIIECFGNYWHKYPLAREIDIKRCQELREKGFRVLVLWENEIRKINHEDLLKHLEENYDKKRC